MAKLNGSLLLVYADGTLVASQKNVTINWEQDLPDASTKDSTGWEEHINGTRRATVDFDCLYDNTGLSAEELIAYITSRANLVLVIDGTGVPIVGEATVKNISINAATEEAASLSGSFKFKGPAWMLTGVYVNILTAYGSSDYDTFTGSGTKVTSAINLAGNAYALSNALAVAKTGVYKVITFLTLNSGQAPSCKLYDSGGGDASDSATLAAGVNVLTLTATATDAAGTFRFTNSAAANWSTSNVYVFKT